MKYALNGKYSYVHGRNLIHVKTKGAGKMRAQMSTIRHFRPSVFVAWWVGFVFYFIIKIYSDNFINVYSEF